MSAAATQVVLPSEAWRSFCHHLGGVVIELALNLPLASKASYLLAPRTWGAQWLFCGPDGWHRIRLFAMRWAKSVILSPCMLLPLTFSLLKLDEDSRKSPIILAEKLWPLRLETSRVFLITGAENFQRASVLVSQICLSEDCTMWLPGAPSQAQSSFQRAGRMVPQVCPTAFCHTGWEQAPPRRGPVLTVSQDAAPLQVITISLRLAHFC